MDVDTSTSRVFGNEVVLPGVIGGDLHETGYAQESPQQGHAVCGQCDIEIAMPACLTSQERIDTPSTVNVHLESDRFEEVE